MSYLKKIYMSQYGIVMQRYLHIDTDKQVIYYDDYLPIQKLLFLIPKIAIYLILQIISVKPGVKYNKKSRTSGL